jgi:hypothetical protein
MAEKYIRLRGPSLCTQRGHHKARILFAVDVLGLGHYPPLAVPAAGLSLLRLPLLDLVAELAKHQNFDLVPVPKVQLKVKGFRCGKLAEEREALNPRYI